MLCRFAAREIDPVYDPCLHQITADNRSDFALYAVFQTGAMSNSGPPDYGMQLPMMFLSDGEEKTFQYDKTLPSLPVPPLNETLEKYLKSVRPLVTEKEFKETERVVREFRSGVGQELQSKLLERSKHQRNWLEKWWEDYAYLILRSPHAPYVNFAGPAPYSREAWPPKNGTQLERAALITWFMLKFWEIVRKEKLRVDKGAKTTVWSMYQFSRMYNGCKTPGETVDQLNDYFRTESTGPVATHLLVICRGRLFTFEAVDRDGHIITAPELELQLRHIRGVCDSQPEGRGLGALTGHNRTDWYKTRQHLIGLHPDNERHLDAVQKSIFTIVLDDASPVTPTEVAKEAVVGNPRLRWFDKTMHLIVFKNGLTASNCDHAPHDAMINVVLSYFTYLGLDACGHRWLGPRSTRFLPVPAELVFHVDDTVLKAISDAERLYLQSNDLMEILATQFLGFGKEFLRPHRLHPDTFMQMALQLGYFKLHGKPAPTYETASTRKFYNGRTETLRSCTSDSLNFSKSMLDPSSSNAVRLQLLHKAMETHLKNMAEAQENRGCDRHLFGLQITALENGLPVPKLFTDPAYTKSGGGGNYVLSTSCVGYTPVYGGVAPMCKDGYGFFYSIESNKFNVFVVCWRADRETSSLKLYESVSWALVQMQKLVEERSTAARL